MNAHARRHFRQARRNGDFAFISAAQVETAEISYGRPWTGEEQQELAERLARASVAPASRLIMLDDGGSPIGYFWLELRKFGVVFLLDLYVAPRQRQQGSGTSLLREAIRQAHEMGAREMRLAAASRNQNATRFFVSHGFEVRDTKVRETAVWFELGKSLIE